MRSMKSVSGLTRCKGVTDRALGKWLLGVTASHNICMGLEDFSGIHYALSEQHEDLRESRRSRDASGVHKLVKWLQEHPPFL